MLTSSNKQARNAVTMDPLRQFLDLAVGSGLESCKCFGLDGPGLQSMNPVQVRP